MNTPRLSRCFSAPAYLLSILVLSVAGRAQVNLTVNATQAIRTVDERVFGVNAVTWDGQTSTPETISLLQAAGVRAIRIPGGSASDGYDWSATHQSWEAGVESFNKLITGINSQAFVTVNYGSGTPEQAAAWVAYCNTPVGGTDVNIGNGVDPKGNSRDWKTANYWAALRGAAPLGTDDGRNFLRVSRSAPVGIKYWEIGNENYGSWERDDHAKQWDPVTYATVAKDFITKMKAVDPTIKIGVVVQTSEDDLDSKSPQTPLVTNPVTGLQHKGWTPRVLATLKSLGVTPDFVIYHRYEQAPKGAFLNTPSRWESDAFLLQQAKSWPDDAAKIRKQLTDYLGTAGAGVEINVTENNSVYGDPGKQTTSLVNGLYLADSIGNVLKTPINSLLWWDLRNGQQNTNNNDSTLYGWRQYGDYGILSSPSSFGSTTAYDPYPTYYMMKLLSKFARDGDTIVQAASNNPLLSIFAAKRTDGSLSLLVINKDPANILNASLALTGFTPGASATVYSYGKPQDTAGSSADIVTSSQAVAGSTFSTSFGSYSATVLSFDVNVAPVIVTQPVSQDIGAGSSFVLTVDAVGSPTPIYQWYKDGSAISGANLSSYSIANITSGSAGTYQVVVTNTAGSVTSDAAVLVVRNLPVITKQPLSSAVFTGGAVSFLGVATSNLALTYRWQRNGIDVPGATNATLSLSNIQVSQAGSYALIVTNIDGSTTSRFARLVVLVPQANATVYTATAYPTGVAVGGNVGLDYVLTNIGTRNWGSNHYLSIRDSNGTFVAFASLIGTNSGESKTVHLSFPAPSIPGTYPYTVQGLEGGVEFFSTQTTFTLTVLAQQPNSVTYNTTNFPTSATPGSNLIFNYNVTNTGSKTWGPNHYLSLRNAAGVYSLFASLNGVAPSQSKTVNLSVTAPSAPGIYSYHVQALENGVEFFTAQANLTLTVLAPQPNAVVYTSTRSQDNVTPGATVNLRYTLSNAGTGTWGASHYASLRDQSGSFLGFVPLSGVAPLGTKVVNFSFVAPTTSGAYSYFVQALEDGVEFFDSQDLVTITVLATPIGNAATYNASTFPSTAARGAAVGFTANLTNRGTKTWGANHFLSLRDADNTFLGFLPLTGVTPGGSQTLTFNFTAPNAPGVYTYHVQGFESGIEFFNMSDNLVLIVP